MHRDKREDSMTDDQIRQLQDESISFLKRTTNLVHGKGTTVQQTQHGMQAQNTTQALAGLAEK